MKVTAIFDIGKTNKKFFLFDEKLREVHRTYARFGEVEDEDGFLGEDLNALRQWMLDTFQEVLTNPQFEIEGLNFSTYGASFVHLDETGQPVAPLYNYLKPFPEDLQKEFFQKYGPAEQWSTQTASPAMGMLNSGLQLYWLKYRRPEVFARIHRSLHFPQYCAWLFSGAAYSDYTSLGCHTGMWDYEQGKYHRWIIEEGIDELLPPIKRTTASTEVNVEGTTLKVGMGIHDSSAALLPYIHANREPFLLISTGTWSITLNPYSKQLLNVQDLNRDCLNFLRVDGQSVRAARLFLGNEYKIWMERLAQHFDVPYEAHRSVSFDETLLSQNRSKVFHWQSIKWPGMEQELPEKTDLSVFTTYREAYHQLMIELVELQLSAIHLAKGDTEVSKIYIDGGFVDNELFVSLLRRGLKEYVLIVTKSPLGSALGAAMAVQDHGQKPQFLNEHFAIQ